MNQKKKKQNPTRKMQKKATGHSTLSLPTLTHTELHTKRTNTHSERDRMKERKSRKNQKK